MSALWPDMPPNATFLEMHPSAGHTTRPGCQYDRNLVPSDSLKGRKYAGSIRG